MAGSAQIGSLRVALGLDSAEFQAGAKRAQSQLAGLTSAIKGFAAGVAGAVTLGGIGAVLKSSINYMDEIGKSAQKIGIPVEQLSGLAYAAELADVSLGDLTTNMGKLSRGLAEIAGGGSNDAGKALRAMGVSALDTNGKLRTTPDILGDIADKFQSYEDGAAKAALSYALFGKSGTQIIPMLNGGRDAIADATAKAKLFGLVVTGESAAAADKFNDSLDDLKKAAVGVAQRVATALLPAMTNITNAIVDYLGKGGGAAAVTDTIVAAMKRMAEVAVTLYYEFQKFAVSAVYWWERINGEPYNPDKFNQLKANLAEIEAQYKKTAATVSGFDFNAPATGGTPAKPGVTKSQAPIVDIAGDARRKKQDADAESRRKQITGVIDALKLENAQLGMSERQQEIMNRLHDAGVTASSKYGREITKLVDANFAYADSLKKQSAEFQIIADYNARTAERGVSNALAKIQDDATNYAAITEQAVTGLYDGMTDALTRFAETGKLSFKDLTRSVLADMAKIAMQKGLANIFGAILGKSDNAMYGGGGSGIMGALSTLKFASGGAILPSGSGGIDSQLVMFHKSPNERVDITKPGQTLTGGGAPNIVIHNNTGSPVSAKTQRNGNGGYDVMLTMKEMVGSMIADGSMDGPLGARFGSRAVVGKRG